jgi:GNAT superfamily N-acetyltransferase
LLSEPIRKEGRELSACTLATPGDVELVLEMMREFYVGERLSYREEIARRGLAELWSIPELGRIYVIQAAEGPAGYAILTFGFSLEFHGRDALVDELYVREAYRGSGLGSFCLAFLEQVCRDEGIHAIHLEADFANARAKRLYHRVGYKDHDRHLLTKWLVEG